MSIHPAYSYENTIEKAASRARGDRLVPLFAVCKTQKTISTRKLREIAKQLWESDRQDAIHFRELAKGIRE